MIAVNKETKQGADMLWYWNNRNYGDITKAYSKPSSTKVSTFNDIKLRAESTEGYNHDLKVVAKSSNFYSTMYSYTVNGDTYLVKDTKCCTYILKL